jgi:hypothetical protein
MHHTAISLRLPASEHAKLAPSRPRDQGHAEPVTELAPQSADIVPARAGQRRHVHHLSGFSRA